MKLKSIGLVTCLLLFVTWPFFSAWVTLFERDWLMMPLLAFLGFVYVGHYFRSRTFIYSCVLFLIFTLNAFLRPAGDEDLYMVVIRICSFISVSAFAYYYFSKAKKEQINFLCKATIWLLIFTTVATVLLHFVYPGAVRNAVGGDLDKAEKILAAQLQRYGLSSFDIIHAIPCLVPAFVMGFKAHWLKQNERLFYLFMAFIVIIHTYITGFTTPLLLAILSFAMSFLVTTQRKQNMAVLIGTYIAIGIILLTPSVMVAITGFLSDLMGADFVQVQDRLGEISNYTQTGDTSEGDIGARMYQYNISLELFRSNIFIGAGNTLGGHSFILDTLAVYGIVGFVAMLMYFTSQFKFILNRLDDNTKRFYYLTIITAVIMLLSKNTGSWTTWCFLFIISPLIMFHVSSK